MLNDSISNDFLQITEDIVGLHGMGTIVPFLSLFIRMLNFNKGDLEKELYLKKTLGIIRGIRKTLFIHTKKMIPLSKKTAGGFISPLKYCNYFKLNYNEKLSRNNKIKKLMI